MKRFGLKKHLQAFTSSCKGAALIEFAIAIPLLLLFLFGTIELCRFLLIAQKVEKTITTVTDAITQSDPGALSNSDLSAYFSAANTLMSPFTLGTNGVVVLTALQEGSDTTQPPTILWQACGGGTLTNVQSQVGNSSQSTTGTLPQGFTMNANEEVIVGEIYFQYTPITLEHIIPSTLLYRYTVFKPRLGLLTSTSTCSNP